MKTQPGGGNGNTLFPWVQGLRAVAALAVAFLHISNDAITAGLDPSGMIAAVAGFMPWAGGVDIFFVISGFVIVHASAPLFGAPGGASRFLRRRLTRIVPLYWLLTTLFLLTALLNRSSIHGATGGAWYVAASYLFIPWPRPDGLMEPALGLGWTLNFEMFFYLTLACCLRLRRPLAVLIAAGALSLLVLMGQTVGFGTRQLTFWSDPIVLEFIMGMALALGVAKGFRLPGWVRLAMVAVAVAALHVGIGGPRVVVNGIPGALLVAAAISAGRTERGSRTMLRLGDASYALYLFHPFVMRALTLLGTGMTTRTETGGVIYIVVSLTVAQLGALAINAGFERKLTTILRGRHGKRPATAG